MRDNNIKHAKSQKIESISIKTKSERKQRLT